MSDNRVCCGGGDVVVVAVVRVVFVKPIFKTIKQEKKYCGSYLYFVMRFSLL